MFENMFLSKEEREKNFEEYQKRLFPLGIKQRDLALLAIRDLVSKKIRDEELLFYFIVSKQKYMENNELSKIYKYLKNRGIFNEDEIKNILSLVILDHNTTSLDSYPTRDIISKRASLLKI